MIAAFLWAFLAAFTLVLGGITAYRVRVPDRTLGWIMGFGAGVLISAVAYELVEGAVTTSAGSGGVTMGLLVGSGLYVVGDVLLARRFGDEALIDGEMRDTPGTRDGGSTGLAIVLGAVMDGIPESIVIGLTLVGGQGIGVAVLVAVLLSNFPEGIAASVELRQAGWSEVRVLGLWMAIAVVCALASMVGYGLMQDAAPHDIAFVDAFAGGAILAMLANTMMPEAYRNGGRLVGFITTLGFIVAFALRAFE